MELDAEARSFASWIAISSVRTRPSAPSPSPCATAIAAHSFRRNIRDEIVPKNILMVGPTGVGKTEIARRLAKLVDAPFVKVEATKFTEVGYVGRDVESIIRDLVEASVRICKEKASQKVKARATVLAEERIIDLILHPNRKPVNPIDVLLGNKPKQPELPAEEKQRIAQKADELRAQLQRGELEDMEIEVEVEDAPKDVEINGASVNIGSMMGDMMPKKTKMRRMKVARRAPPAGRRGRG